MTRVVVVGASGNVGTRTVANLRADGAEVVGVARRPPADGEGMSWVRADIGAADAQQRLLDVFRGADAVVHLAWEIQPQRDPEQQFRTNVLGSRQVVDAVLAAGVPTLAYASSVGAYSPGPKDRAVDETWPTEGIPTSGYSRHKAEVERILDHVENEHPELRVVRFRPGLVFQRAAASEIARYFLGPFVPLSAMRRRLIPFVPAFSRLAIQCVHADDVARAFARAVSDPQARGAYNLAAEPVLDAQQLAETLGAMPVPTPLAGLRFAADLAYRARVIPIEAGWLDMAAAVPVMSTERARTELGWTPRHSAPQALLELLDGMKDRAGGGTAALRPDHAASEEGRIVPSR